MSQVAQGGAIAVLLKALGEGNALLDRDPRLVRSGADPLGIQGSAGTADCLQRLRVHLRVELNNGVVD